MMVENLAIFAHYDRFNDIAAHVVHYLRALRTTGFKTVLVTTSDLPATERAKLFGLVSDVIVRPNRGFDFGSWQEGIARYRSPSTDDLLIVNDSVYGPLGDLGEALSRLRAVPADAYGMVASADVDLHVQSWHLQSWFVLLRPTAHRHDAFRAMFAQDFAPMTKLDVIRQGEVRMSQALRDAGLRLRALYEPPLGGLIPPVSVNPAHVIWRDLVQIYGVPFIKVELLRSNPCKIARLTDWRALVAARTPELVPMIEAHLARTTDPMESMIEALHAYPCRQLGAEGFARREQLYARLSTRLPLIANRLLWQARRSGQKVGVKIAALRALASKSAVEPALD